MDNGRCKREDGKRGNGDYLIRAGQKIILREELLPGAIL
jgi:hypothetical protein